MNTIAPTIIRGAVPRAQCDTAATELTNSIAVGEQDSYVKYKLTPTCAEIARQAHEVSISHTNVRQKLNFPRLTHLPSAPFKRVFALAP